MNPIVIWRIISGIAALLGIGGAAYGVDQNQKRKREQAAHRARLEQLESDLTNKEAQLGMLHALLGEKNEQVRNLAAEVARLRSEVAAARRSA
jgi:capsule polysaccharide export protein KpsE/RkpR